MQLRRRLPRRAFDNALNGLVVPQRGKKTHALIYIYTYCSFGCLLKLRATPLHGESKPEKSLQPKDKQHAQMTTNDHDPSHALLADKRAATHATASGPSRSFRFAWRLFCAISISVCGLLLLFGSSYLDHARFTLNPFFLGAVTQNLNQDCSFGVGESPNLLTPFFFFTTERKKNVGPGLCSGPYSCADLVCQFIQEREASFTAITYTSMACTTSFDNDALWDLTVYRWAFGLGIACYLAGVCFALLGLLVLWRSPAWSRGRLVSPPPTAAPSPLLFRVLLCLTTPLQDRLGDSTSAPSWR